MFSYVLFLHGSLPYQFDIFCSIGLVPKVKVGELDLNTTAESRAFMVVRGSYFQHVILGSMVLSD